MRIAIRVPQSTRSIVVKNASLNLMRLAGTGTVAIILPAFLVRKLSTDVYAAWALLLQLTLYVGFLDFGIQTAVARFVAHAQELGNIDERDGIVSTAFVCLLVACLLAILVVVVVAWQWPNIFPSMPSSLYFSTRVALLLMGASLALGLPASVVQAIFTGQQRNEVPVSIAVANRVLMGGMVIGAVLMHRGLIAMGIAVVIANIFSYSVSYFALRKWAGRVRIRMMLVAKAYAKQILSYSSVLAVWSVATLMISGLDLTIVGIFDYKATAYYAVAATLTNFVAQAQNAIFAALLPAAAVLGARGNAAKLGAVLISSTRYGMLLLVAMALPLLLAAHLVLHIWVGQEYARNGTLILQVLLLGNVIRLCGLPYSTLLLGTGEQNKVIISPLAEGATNLAASVIGAWRWGAIGVAYGTLLGAVVSIAFHFFYNMPRTSLIAVNRRLFMMQGVLRPLVCALPLTSAYVFHLMLPGLATLNAPMGALLGAALVATILLVWLYGLVPDDRQRLRTGLGSFLSFQTD